MKILCVGKNYSDHVREMGTPRPKDPVIFLKPETSLMKSDTFYIPEFSEEIHHEVEVIVCICKAGKYIAPRFASKYYDAVGLGIDFTARDLQTQLKRDGLPWDKAKAFDNSAFASEWLPKESFGDLQNLSFRLEKNQKNVQKGNTRDMLVQINDLIAYISQFFTVKKGDIIYTGTPAGVGKVAIGDVLEGYLQDRQMFGVKIM